jgi:hypothetical protein
MTSVRVGITASRHGRPADFLFVYRLKDVDAASLTQRIQSQQTGLRLGRYRAAGATGVVALVIVALAWFILKYLTH